MHDVKVSNISFLESSRKLKVVGQSIRSHHVWVGWGEGMGHPNVGTAHVFPPPGNGISRVTTIHGWGVAQKRPVPLLE